MVQLNEQHRAGLRVVSIAVTIRPNDIVDNTDVIFICAFNIQLVSYNNRLLFCVSECYSSV